MQGQEQALVDTVQLQERSSAAESCMAWHWSLVRPL